MVNKTSEIIEADKISLNFSKKFLSDFKTPKGDYRFSIPITVQDLLDTLKIASILHDIGKLAIPDNILLKPGKLTPEEFEIIKLHPIVGDEILKPLRFFHQERKIIRHQVWSRAKCLMRNACGEGFLIKQM